jgi:transcriptional regulator with XRE-family HTH domain
MKQQMLNNLQGSKEYRHAFTEETIRTRLTAQIEAMRTERGWDYKKFAEEIDKKVSWAYRLEDPNATVPTIPTLLEVAEAFDIGVDVRFRAFSELLDDVTSLNAKSFSVPSFESELRTGAFSKPRRTKKTPRYGSNPRRKATSRTKCFHKRAKGHGSSADIHVESSPQPQFALAS